jgi:hypothetical protein
MRFTMRKMSKKFEKEFQKIAVIVETYGESRNVFVVYIPIA